LGNGPPFDTLENITGWAKSLGYLGVQVPAWDKRVIDIDQAAQEGAGFIKSMLIDTPKTAFDKVAGGGMDMDYNKRILGLN
jgi:hypothetical protein